jgi:hypothetical protein
MSKSIKKYLTYKLAIYHGLVFFKDRILSQQHTWGISRWVRIIERSD